MEDVRAWGPLLVSFAALLTTWVVNLRSARRTEIAGLETRIGGVDGKIADQGKEVAELETRVAKVESTLGHLPTKEQVHKLEVNTVELRGDVKALAETTKGVASTASRLEGYLLSAEKRATAGV